MKSEVAVVRASESDLEALKSWLVAASLPVEDLTAAHMCNFLLAQDGGKAVGMVGLEQFGEFGLLRSLVVQPAARRYGTGRALVAAIEKQATELGVKDLWLITIDADRYFARLGFETAKRDIAPAAIQMTKEYSSLCPGDAVLMHKKLLERSLERD